ncbi:dephospho-CoA kinase [Candidatus Gottesmanbacteria bacterium CG11_big_fil_rev_8_21_14_0_20_37_11]|uniref:Dephospho-CoA kinase n=3 Tax=Candidatus Gottesmaniibacteriota TaxID=1752720 RepID=A0A2M7RRZ0_9BACT|nr:MAG: hypothetical protein AUJ73_00290 [Candidatus Gottesmanbacteria bacterium CG1_02_37_22]PIP32630.1 MAG: dephospho-CoA kinase [Candidatus Gottesmanbacteria bacterium CG23_combo_of_CG06-09_8_20_14_all_37_19]PIR08506.1 MAG: dephospho-CoA kinase [Candidatus Gottesmanbacteria bacterium CG11_big_fil_rev_8_21_14_0_20_37_11]PIZ03062.1 MAG: dephospho-CoA kinase [Candidatus Gottesmanbacteria bacterium CG_4_10_14_0_8_um_filter_37_24]
MSITLLALVGLPGSGKTTASSYFKKEGMPVIRMGDITDNLLNKDKVPFNEENEKKYREYIRIKYGKEIYAKLATPKISAELKHKSLVIVDGLRSREELDYFKEKFPYIKVLYIDVPRKVRYQRLKHRLIRPLNVTEAKKRDKNEISRFKLTDIKKTAEYIIKNEESLSHFQRQLSLLVHKLRKNYD